MVKILWLILLFTSYCVPTFAASKAASKGGNYAVPRGQTVRMSCIPPGVRISNADRARSFVWTDEEGRDIMNRRMARLETGELQIIRAREGDSGVYHCKLRPPEALTHGGAVSRMFIHKLIVYQLSGHKYETLVAFDVTRFGSDATITLLRNLLRSKVCSSELCIPGRVNSEKCEVTETEKQMCEMSMTYEALEPTQTATCNETCVREIMIARLKKAQKLLETSLLDRSEDSKSLLRPDMKSFDTKHVITCEAGYHLIESNYEHCFPCLPGTYSESDNLKCDYCPVSFYQEKYGSRGCQPCPGDLTTEMAGSKSRDDCRPLTDTGIMKDIKEGIAAIFKG